MSYLDIFEKVGKAVAHDEYIPFKVSKGKVLVNDEESELVGKKIRVEFIKVKYLRSKYRIVEYNFIFCLCRVTKITLKPMQFMSWKDFLKVIETDRSAHFLNSFF